MEARADLLGAALAIVGRSRHHRVCSARTVTPHDPGELGSEPLSRMQRFLPPTTMPASDWPMAPCSHLLPSGSLAARAFTPRAARTVKRTPTDPQAPVARSGTSAAWERFSCGGLVFRQRRLYVWRRLMCAPDLPRVR